METKKVKAVLIGCKEKSPIFSYNKENICFHPHINNDDDTFFYELVLVSLDPDEKIKVGDIFLDSENYLRVCTEIKQNIGIIQWEDGSDVLDSCKKVIATQEQLSPEFITWFVYHYNMNTVGDLEIEIWDNSDYNPSIFPDIRPKLTNGFITVIKKESPVLNFKDTTLEQIKEKFPITYTEEEVRKLLNKGIGEAISYPECFVTGICFDSSLFNNWFKQNKKK